MREQKGNLANKKRDARLHQACLSAEGRKLPFLPLGGMNEVWAALKQETIEAQRAAQNCSILYQPGFELSVVLADP